MTRDIGLLVWLLVMLAGVARGEPAPLVANAAASNAFITRALAAGRCFAVDTEVDTEGKLLAGVPEDALDPGQYRLHVLLARAPLGDAFSQGVEVTITVNGDDHPVNPLIFAMPDEFVDVPVDFLVTPGQRDHAYAITWRVPAAVRKQHKTAARMANDDDPEANDILPADLVNRPTPAADGSISMADLPKLPYNLAVCGVHLERLSPLRLTVHTDKMVYKPGEEGTATITLTNVADTPVMATFTAALCFGVEGRQELAARKLAVPAGGSTTWSAPFSTTGLRWGAEVTASATVEDGRIAAGRIVVGVTNNFFEVAMLGAQAINHGRTWKDPAVADAWAQGWRETGQTGCECFFWAPCDFSDFTPELEDFFSGQTQYTHSISGTRNLLAALHARGMVGTVYANLWGTDGGAGFETLRQHPEWFSANVQYASDYLEFWRLMEEKKVAPMQQWCETTLIQEPEVTAEAIALHANELIASHRQFGWDGVRYDSYYSTPWTKWATRKTRDLVTAAVPGFQFGYNTFPGADAKVGALAAMYDGGGMAMLEYIRLEDYPKLQDYLAEICYNRSIVWPSGGHIGPIYRLPAPQPNQPTMATPIDDVVVSSVLLATGAHPYYYPPERAIGQHPRFALRYSEYLWDNRMRELADPGSVIRFGNGAQPFQWEALAHTMTLDGQRRRLVIHVLNIAPDYQLFTNLAQRTLPPLRKLPVTITLPAGAQLTGVWNLCPVPDAHHERLAAHTAGDAITVIVPEVRFWNVLVVEYTAPQALAEKPTMAAIIASCIQDWYLAGPFPSQGKTCDGYDAIYPPERGVDLAATYSGDKDAKVTWQRTSKPGDPPLGPGPIDLYSRYPPGEDRCAYAYTRVVSDRDREALLLVGSDDTIQIWLNGKLVHANRVFRGVNLDNDRVPITLKKGVNTLLLKVCSHDGGWGFILRLAEKDGAPLTDGVQYGWNANP